MSKTKEQVNRYLTHCKFPDDDWSKILLYCRKSGFGYAHKSIRPKSESTYDQFIHWLDYGYGSGDVVRYGHTVSILSTCTPGYSAFCAYYPFDGELLVSDLQISTDKIIAPSEGDARDFYTKLKLSGLDFDKRLSLICERKLPAVNTRITYHYGGITGYGVIEKYSNDAAHFLFGIENGVLKRDFDIPVYELSAETIDRNGVVVISDTLSNSLLRWNYSTRQLEDLNPRVKSGETYWYITDKFTVSSAIENRTPTSNTRYERGNYFIDHVQALEFLLAIQELRNAK